MPHKVATFFRSHPPSIDSIPAEKKKKAVALPLGLTRTQLVNQDGTISSSSSVHSGDSMSNKRHSLNLNSARSSSKSLQHVPARLDVEIESPPLVYFGSAASSSGALLSGQLKLNILDEMMAVESLQMKLVLDVKMRKPFHVHCPECTNQSTDLTAWTFLQAPHTFSRGEHDYPFSFLLPGHLPATVHGALSSVDYVLRAQVTSKAGETITFNRELNVKRSIQPSELPRQSIRIFPPTNLTSHIELPSVIHPIGQFKCSLRLDGVVKRNVEARTQTHWKLKRLTWRIEETQKVISPACPKHATKAGAGPDEKKGVAHQDVKILNAQELKSGWKADYAAGADASVEMEFPFSVRADSNPQCDVKAEDGTEISHSLIVELIVAEEVAPISRLSHATPTGAARVLRMNFNIPVTERSGLGVSWDEEQPPLYEDVPASPPGYGTATVEDYTGPAIPDYEELETMRE